MTPEEKIREAHDKIQSLFAEQDQIHLGLLNDLVIEKGSGADSWIWDYLFNSTPYSLERALEFV